jgi:3-dehydroquinate synthase class II
MIRLHYDTDIPGYRIESVAPSDPMERVRHLGRVAISTIGLHASVVIDGSYRGICNTQSLPNAIHELIDFHKLTDYQYAPWPTMEEDEE